MKILFVASMAIISADPVKSRRLFIDTLNLPLKQHEGDDDYYFSEKIDGAKHFGVWPLSQAAEACFGVKERPNDRPIPQTSIEFEVEDADSVSSSAKELIAAGYKILHEVRTEPWGQVIARIQTLEGAIVGISYAPWLHK